MRVKTEGIGPGMSNRIGLSSRGSCSAIESDRLCNGLSVMPVIGDTARGFPPEIYSSVQSPAEVVCAFGFLRSQMRSLLQDLLFESLAKVIPTKSSVCALRARNRCRESSSAADRLDRGGVFDSRVGVPCGYILWCRRLASVDLGFTYCDEPRSSERLDSSASGSAM